MGEERLSIANDDENMIDMKERKRPPSPLPAGWVMKESRSQPDCYYYYHQESGLSSWQPPVKDPNRSTRNAAEIKSETAAFSSPVVVPIKTEQNAAPEKPKDRKRKEPSAAAASASSTASAATTSNKKKKPSKVRVLHILKKHAASRRPASWRNPKITATLAQAREELSGLVDILQESADNPEDLRATFEELARTESDCSSAKRGGDLGFFGPKKMQPAFEEASFALQIGQLSSIVETSSGVHVILRVG